MIVRELLARLGVEIDEGSFNAADKIIEATKGKILAIGAAYGAVKLAVAGMVKATTDYASEVHDLSAATGVSAENLQVLGYVGKLTGVSMEEMAHGLAHLNKAAYEAAHGSGEMAAKFRALGVAVTGPDGKLRDVNELLPEMASALAKIQNPAERGAVSMLLMGRAGARLAQAMQRFGGDFEGAAKEAKALGIVLSDQLIEQGDALGDTFDRATLALKGTAFAIAGPMLGGIQRVVEHWIRFINVNRKWIALGLHRAFETVHRLMAPWVELVVFAVGGLKQLAEATIGVKAGLGALAGIALLITSPFLAMLAVLAIVAEDIYSYFQGRKSITGRIVFAFEKMAEEIRKKGFLGFLSEVFDSALDSAKKFFAFLEGKTGTSGGSTLADKGVGTQLAGWIREWWYGFFNGPMNLPSDQWTGQQAWAGVPGSKTGYTLIDDQWYPWDTKTGAGTGKGPAHFDINIRQEFHGPADPEAVGKASSGAVDEAARRLQAAGRRSGGGG